MRTENLIRAVFVLALFGCESAPEPEQAAEEPPAIPSISAAPGSRAESAVEAPIEPAEEIVAELAAAAGDEDDEAQPEMMKQGAKRSRSGPARGGLGGVGKGGSGAGSGGGASSVAGLLEAKAPGTWRVRLAKTDGDATATRSALQKRGAAFDRCLAFLGEDVKKLTATITYANKVVSEVATVPDDSTVGECIRSQVGHVRLTSPSTLQLEFNR